MLGVLLQVGWHLNNQAQLEVSWSVQLIMMLDRRSKDWSLVSAVNQLINCASEVVLRRFLVKLSFYCATK